jgi:hypothetical protein
MRRGRLIFAVFFGLSGAYACGLNPFPGLPESGSATDTPGAGGNFSAGATGGSAMGSGGAVAGSGATGGSAPIPAAGAGNGGFAGTSGDPIPSEAGGSGEAGAPAGSP